MKSRFLFPSFFVLTIALTAPPTLAQNFSVTATASADGSGESHTSPTSASAQGNYANSAFSGDISYPNVTIANASVTGQQGLITGGASSSTYNEAYSYASAKANWTDSLTVMSSSLTFGTPVQIVFLALYQASSQTGVYEPLYGSLPNTTTSLDFETQATDVATGDTAPLIFKRTYQGPSGFVHNDGISIQATLNTTAGASINLSSLVDIETVTNAGDGRFFKLQTYSNGNISSALNINAPANVSIISASGHSYASTPEPTSFPVFAVGMSVFFFGLRRRKRTVRSNQSSRSPR